MKRFFIILMSLALAGCASVKVSTLDSSQYIEARRGDVITTGKLSQQTDESLYILGYENSSCLGDVPGCLHNVLTQGGLNDEQRESALSEIWLYRAFDLHKQLRNSQQTMSQPELKQLATEAIKAYLKSAKAAYLYLFFTDRKLQSRALEDRQTQVRDYYNLSVQNAVEILYQAYKDIPDDELNPAAGYHAADWTLKLDSRFCPTLQDPTLRADTITADSTISFEGIRNEYVRDGLGARMIVTMREKNLDEAQADSRGNHVAARLAEIGHRSGKHEISENQSWERMSYIPITVLAHFPGKTFKEVASSHTAILTPYEIDRDYGISINQTKVPLAANYSAAYGLWLANSKFATQSLATVFGKGDMLERPRVYLMQPYRPERRTIVLIHGLASSPEAWVNTANEIMGDEELRNNYQIWQVYYPTSMPIIISRREIAKVLSEAFHHFDPEGDDPASRNVVVIGHSMGGIISRLLVSSSGNALWDRWIADRHPNEERQKEVREKLGSYFFFEPMDNFTRAVFLAAPHQGTPYTEKTFAKILLSLVKLPFSVANTVLQSFKLLSGQDVPYDPDSMSGVGNLSDKDPTIQALAHVKISPKVTYYSIIGDKTGGPLEEMSDGIVPYWSSHLSGASREVIIPSGHSVQETPKAILEIRSILREHLLALKAGTGAPSLTLQPQAP